jgi:ABC-type spermidine/putrescine transport system permease subunit II
MMRKLAVGLLFALPVALLGLAFYLIAFAPPQPDWDWENHMSSIDHDALVALLGHRFRVAAYAVTWAVQLGYVAWLGLRWQRQKRAAGSTASPCR